MKFYLIAIGVCALLVIKPSNLLAAKEDGKKAKLFAKYDKNKNDVLDADEKKAIGDDYAKEKDGNLKAFDKDGDGKLSDKELDGIKPGNGKAKEAKTKKKDAEKAKPADDDKAKKSGEADKPKTEK